MLSPRFALALFLSCFLTVFSSAASGVRAAAPAANPSKSAAEPAVLPGTEIPLYSLTLTNNTKTTITQVRMESAEFPEPYQQSVPIPPGASIRLNRPEADLIDIVFTHDKGSLSFSGVSFFEERDTRASLSLASPDIPELVFFDEQKERRMALTGENSDWKFPQILGSIPFGPGVTTYAEALALGAQPDTGKTAPSAPGAAPGSAPAGAGTSFVLRLGLEWEFLPWSARLRFETSSPESRLRSYRLSMAAAPKEDDIDPATPLDDTLTRHGYRAISETLGQTVIRRYAYPDDESFEAAIVTADEAYGERGYPSATLYAPNALAEALAVAGVKGADAVLAGRPADLLVRVTVSEERYCVVSVFPASELAFEESKGPAPAE